MTYDELVTKIRDYTEVDANVLTSTIVNGFIQDAEFRLLRDVDSDNNRRYRYDTSNLVNGQRFIDIPLNTLVIRSAQVSDGTTFNAGTTRTFLEKRDTSFISEFNSTGKGGQPKYYANWDENYANWDENTIALAPIPDNTYAIQVNYILKPEGLSSTNTNTYLSDEFPNGLLYACLVEAYGFLKGPADMLQFYEQK
jgi:hypothetical protein